MPFPQPTKIKSMSYQVPSPLDSCMRSNCPVQVPAEGEEGPLFGLDGRRRDEANATGRFEDRGDADRTQRQSEIDVLARIKRRIQQADLVQQVLPDQEAES